MSHLTKLQRNMTKLYQQSEDVGIHAPQVIHKRLTMFAQQNPLNNQQEVHEMERMVHEKAMAFVESWQDMGIQSLVAQYHIHELLFDNWVKVLFGKPIALDQLFYQINLETLKVVEKGMLPIHRRVVANAKRLA